MKSSWITENDGKRRKKSVDVRDSRDHGKRRKSTDKTSENDGRNHGNARKTTEEAARVIGAENPGAKGNPLGTKCKR